MNELVLGTLADGRTVTAVLDTERAPRLFLQIDGADWLSINLSRQEGGVLVTAVSGAGLAITPRAANAFVILAQTD